MSQFKQMNNHKNVKINTLKLNYHPSLASELFTPIADKPWSMLLRSASEDHPNSRYDILVTNPIATLTTTGEQTLITTNGSSITSQEDPFLLLQHYLETLLPNLANTLELPFIGGALGYLGYDLGRRVEALPSIATQDIHMPDMAIGLYDWAVVIDHQEKSAVVVGSNVEENYHWLHLKAQQPITRPPFELTSNWQSNMSKEHYQEKFHTIEQYLLSGDCYQINLAQRYCANYRGSEWEAYQLLEQTNSAPFSAYIHLESISVLSISPERFLQLGGTKIETKPIKGTRPRSQNHEIDLANIKELVNTEKDQAENLMIVDLLRNDIGRVAKPGSVKVPQLFAVESFPAVHHLVSTITAELEKSYSATDLLRACFPGGSITGAPKVRAMEIIEELEPHRRGVYCGSIGYMSRCGKMDTNIAIRTLVTSEQKLYAWAGGGIVADSHVDSEYQETLDKLSRILPTLKYHGKANTGE